VLACVRMLVLGCVRMLVLGCVRMECVSLYNNDVRLYQHFFTSYV
jgi:hypothetical protein